jgi:hypothetical protein
MTLAYIFLFFGGAIAIWRIWINIKRARDRPAHSWDARLIEKLRLEGSDPFQPHDVVFFFGLPSEKSAQLIVERLVREGYQAEYRQVHEQVELAFSVHAQRSLRLSVPDMQATSRRFNELAAEFHGRYDGWAAASNRKIGD